MVIKRNMWLAVIFMFFAAIITGCSAGSDSANQAGQGVYSLSIDWPEQNNNTERIIPEGTSSIQVTITGDELTNPVSTTVTTSQTTVEFSLPTGQKVATIKALDSSGNITAQRKESFIILNGETSTSDHIPLGAAIVESDSTQILEPSDIKMTYGSALYVQNWSDSSVKVEGLGYPISLEGASQGAAGKWNFSETSLNFYKNYYVSLNGGPYNYKVSLYQPSGSRYTADLTIDGRDTSNGGLTNPTGVAVDRTRGVVYVADNYDFCIKKFSLTGTFLTKWGGCSYNNKGDFMRLCDISTGPNGDVLVADCVANSIFKYNSAGTMITRWGALGTTDGNFNSASSAVFDQEGNVYTTDLGNNRVQKFTSTGQFLTKFGSVGTAVGCFNGPYGVAVSPVSPYYIYVSDNSNNRIQRFNSDGTSPIAWGTSGVGDSNFDNLRYISVADDGTVFAADMCNFQVKKFSSSGSFLSKWGTRRSAPNDLGDYNYPVDVDLDSSGNFYAVEFLNDRLQKVSQAGTVLTWWGSDRTKNGVISRPYRVAVNSAGDIYVPERAGHRIQVFDSAGGYKFKWGTFGTTNSGSGTEMYSPKHLGIDSSGNIYYTDYSTYIRKFGPSGNMITSWKNYGTANGQYMNPYSFVPDLAGNIYVTDTSNYRIQKLDSAFGYLAKWGSQGTGNGQLSAPYAAVPDSEGNMYVADFNNYRIVKFNFSSSTAITMWGSRGNDFGKFMGSVSDVCVDSDGYVYVAENNARVQKFTSSGSFVACYDSRGGDPGQISSVSGLSIDSSGNLYLSDFYLNRIVRLKKQ